MKKILTLIFSLLIISSSAEANTLYIDLDKIPESAVQKIKHESKDLIKSELDLTNVVAFVREWQDNETRKNELLNLYSSIVPKAFKMYPKSKEFHLDIFISYNNKNLVRKETRYVSRLIVTKNDFNKVDWKNIKETTSKKHIKVMDFFNL